MLTFFQSLQRRDPQTPHKRRDASTRLSRRRLRREKPPLLQTYHLGAAATHETTDDPPSRPSNRHRQFPKREGKRRWGKQRDGGEFVWRVGLGGSRGEAEGRGVG